MLSKDETLWSALAVLRFRPVILQPRRFSQKDKGRKAEDGKFLEVTVREEMEELLGCDFRDVRIYDDRKAEEIACQLNAEAFAVGKKVFAPKGKLDTTTLAGKALLAHELTHVAQQTQESASAWSRMGRPLPSMGATHGTVDIGVQRAAVSSRSGVAGDALQEAREMEAQALERLIREAGSAMLTTSPEQSNAKMAEIDVEDIADKVYGLMQSELILERERARV